MKIMGIFLICMTFSVCAMENTTFSLMTLYSGTTCIEVNLQKFQKIILNSDYANSLKNKENKKKYINQLLNALEFFFNNLGNISELENAIANSQISYYKKNNSRSFNNIENSHSVVLQLGKIEKKITIPPLVNKGEKKRLIHLVFFPPTQHQKLETAELVFINKLLNPQSDNQYAQVDLSDLERYIGKNFIMELKPF